MLSHLFRAHAQSLIYSLGRIFHDPLAGALTIASIGVAFALPLTLWVALQNASPWMAQWEGMAHVSLYLKPEVDAGEARRLAERLRREEGIREVRLITKEEGLRDFSQAAGLGEAFQLLGENPLPEVLLVYPRRPEEAASLQRRLARLPQVDAAQLDAVWVERMQAIMAIARRAAAGLMVLLGAAVLLIVGNTIRLDIQSQQQAIEVQALVGATKSFIRRPFLYMGAIYGLLGGMLAWGLTSLALAFLDGPVKRLFRLYGSAFELKGLGWKGGMALLLCSSLLGLAGAWLAVGRHLKEHAPR